MKCYVDWTSSRVKGCENIIQFLFVFYKLSIMFTNSETWYHTLTSEWLVCLTWWRRTTKKWQRITNGIRATYSVWRHSVHWSGICEILLQSRNFLDILFTNVLLETSNQKWAFIFGHLLRYVSFDIKASGYVTASLPLQACDIVMSCYWSVWCAYCIGAAC